MNAPKNEALELIRALPDDFTMEDIQYHLYVKQKVVRGIQAIDESHLVPQEQAEQKVQEWLKSSGPSRP